MVTMHPYVSFADAAAQLAADESASSQKWKTFLSEQELADMADVWLGGLPEWYVANRKAVDRIKAENEQSAANLAWAMQRLMEEWPS